MTKTDITTMLMFAGQAEEAMTFYTSLFEDSGIDLAVKYDESTPGPADKIVHARFHIAGQPVLAMDSNVEQPFTFTPSTSFFVVCPTAEEVDRLYAALAEGGGVMMGLDEYPFAKRYAWVNDRFGVSWQLMFGGPA